jgi:5'-3' exonuclease
MKNLLIDFANLTAITRFGIMSKNASTLLMEDEEWENYFLDAMLVSLANYINVLKADRVILTGESKSWRKTFYPLYKANRDANKEADEKLDLFYNAVNKATAFMEDFTNAKVIRTSGAEGDDIIAVLTQKFSAEGEKTVIVSTDGDFKQLLRFKGVRIFHPIKKAYITEYSHLEYITKIIKGDAGDNVPTTYPRIKPEVLESIALDEKHLEHHFDIVDKTIGRQKFFIAKFLEIDEIPSDLTTDEWEEVISIAKEKKTKLLNAITLAKNDDTYKTNTELQRKEKRLKDIIKMAKKENITEPRLFSIINSFRDGFHRNKKLICLHIDNIPEHITNNILDEYNRDHSASKQSEFLKFVRNHKLKEFAFGSEWNTLKAIQKNI